MAGGGWKASKQFLEHDNYASCFSSREMAKQKLTKVSGKKKKKDHLWAQNKLDKFQAKGWAGECYRLLRHRLVITNHASVWSLQQSWGCRTGRLHLEVRWPRNKIISPLLSWFSIYTLLTGLVWEEVSPCCLSENVPEDHRHLRMKSRLFLFS